jgi:type I restriction enzyme S subunit
VEQSTGTEPNPEVGETTAGILKISQEDISQIALPIPPAGEASQILHRVSEALVAITDTLSVLDTEAGDAARMKQSILKAAFEGRLARQDSSEEPARAGLARLGSNSTNTHAKRSRLRKSIS